MGEREDIRSALPEKPLKVFEIMRRANMSNEDSCQSLLLKMRDEPPRVCRRLQLLRGWSHDEQDDEQVFT